MVIAARDDHRMLVRKHVEVAWPEVAVVEHALGTDPALDEQFAAVGFDAVIIVGARPTDAITAFAAGLAARTEFAPILLLLLEAAPETEPAPLAGMHRLYGRKLDRERLIKMIKKASSEHRQAIALLRANKDYENLYRFGSVLIRGHRCMRQVGSGGMCKVYLAESERAGTVVVLKVFSQVPDVSERSVGFDRFLQEYEIIAYIAMEHFPAGDLRQRMREPLPPSMAVRFLSQIASALEAIHSVGVLHRDLKPANIMLRVDGSVSLIDFGLAKTNETEASLTGSREIFGTPYYMSPEQGHAEVIDARSDLYSLGVVFYEMLIGRKPFNGATAMEVIYKHKRAELPEIAAEFTSYEGLLRGLLAKSPADRFQSAGALLGAIAALKVPA
jgi:hypothetical protein